ncbi:hypothetical protein BJX99DRAFT_242298 [Aspergillus californicus]
MPVKRSRPEAAMEILDRSSVFVYLISASEAVISTVLEVCWMLYDQRDSTAEGAFPSIYGSTALNIALPFNAR